MNMSIPLLCNYVVNLAMILSNSADNMINYCVSYSLYDFAHKVLELYQEPDMENVESELEDNQIEKFEYLAPTYNKEGEQVLYLNNLGNPYSDLKLDGYDVIPISPFYYFDNGMPEKLTKETFHKGISYYNINISLNNNELHVFIWLEYLKFHQSLKEKLQYKLKGGGKVWMEELCLYAYRYEFKYNCENNVWELKSSFPSGTIYKDRNKKRDWQPRSKEIVPYYIIVNFEEGYYML